MSEIILCSENDFKVEQEDTYINWISTIADHESVKIGVLTYVFCNDDYLLQQNIEFLNHDTLTDIITFNYNENGLISGDIFISTERVEENAELYNTTFEKELRRVMSHGVLHLIGYDDKTENEKKVMRQKETEMMELFHVKP